MKPQHIFDKLTSSNVYISYGVKRELFESQVKKYIGVSENVEGSYAKCILYKKLDSRIIWIWTSKKDVPALVHESVHAAQYIFELIGTPINDSTSEPFAYYVQWIVKEALKG